MVSFPLPFSFLLATDFLGAGWAIFRPVGLWREAGPALTAPLYLVMLLCDLGAQYSVQREDSRPEPAA